MGGGWELASDVVVLTEGSSSSHGNTVQGNLIDDFQDLEALHFIQIEGCDKQGRSIARIVGKFLPASITDKERLQRYTLLKFAKYEERKFAILYFHTSVQGSENSPGVKTLRQIYEALSPQVKTNLEVVYFVHPGIRSRLLLGTLGRFFLSDGLYWKVQYISRLEFLRDKIKDGQVNIPEFVFEHDDELENNPLIDYGICVDPLHAEMKNEGPTYSSSRAFF